MPSTPIRMLTVFAGTAVAFAGFTFPAHAMLPVESGVEGGVECFEPAAVGAASARGANPRQLDHRDITAQEQRAIEAKTARILAKKGQPGGGIGGSGPQTSAVTVPVYVHVMADADGSGDVTDAQITEQIAVLNDSFAGENDAEAADTRVSFELTGIDRFYNKQFHRDKQTRKYRAETRQGGKNALNIWLVDFNYLGIATFPWDYAAQPEIDGIRVQYNSLPGGSITNYNLGETATHEAGHWFGLYHTFQGGCNEPGDEVSDTAAQASPTTGCPEGRDSCTEPGFDPIHNYMDYSYDSCYNQFSPGQASRVDTMWAAYRA